MKILKIGSIIISILYLVFSIIHKKYKALFFTAIILSFFFVWNTVYADVIGQRTDFNVNSEFDKYKRTSLSATLRHVGENIYFYIEDNYWNSLGFSGQNSLLTNVKALAEEFDKNIYPEETALWGLEPNPGVDGDPRVIILLEELLTNNGGYFDTVNGYTKELSEESNEREMISLNAEVLVTDLFITKMFLAHEFQHLISFNQKNVVFDSSEDVWLNELRSEYSISVAGYNDPYPNSNLDRRAYIFSNNQSDSLTEWPNKNSDYAMVALFAEYLVEQFGPNVLSETLRSPFTGISSLNKYFIDKGYYGLSTGRFGDVFINWLGALYLNDISENIKLGYKRLELKNIKASPQQRIYLSPGLREYSSTHYLKDWQPLWLEYDMSSISNDQSKSARIDINGEPGQNFIASYLAFYNNGETQLGKINVVSGRGYGYVLNSGNKLNKIVVLATKSTKISGFGKSEASNYLNVKASMVETKNAQAGTLKDGALIKRPREKEIYVIWGKYKRYLNPGVISLYGHLDPTNAIELEPALFDSYQTSNYVKYVNDEKVYAVWPPDEGSPDGTKHWLNITPQRWDASRRDWNAIFTINDLELNFYRTGVNITR